jgi:malate synthase
MSELRGLHEKKMHVRPEAGSAIYVRMKDGSVIDCVATMIYSAKGEGVYIYHKGKAIDESSAAAWWPNE